MKKRLIAWSGILLLTLFLVACTPSAGDDARSYPVTENTAELVVFTAPDDLEPISLKEYLDGLTAAGTLTYTIADGMITSLNGTENVTGAAGGSYWMIYCDLLEKDGVIYADPAYSYSYNGLALASSSYGAEGLPVLAGYTYALVYEEMSW